jgi:hypothetical protein
MMKAVTIYRIENPDTMHGMWYRLDGTYDPFIMTLTEGRSKDLPMEKHPRYTALGIPWFSAGKSVENMNQWFSPLDAKELNDAGYKLFSFTVQEYQMEEMQCLFTRRGVITQVEIPLEDIWNLKE